MKISTPALLLIGCFWIQGSLRAEMREWTSSGSPAKKVTGDLQSVEGDTVVLKLESGRVVKFEISMLSEADQAFVRTGKEPGTEPKPAVAGPEISPAKAIEPYVFDEDPDEVYARLKKQKGLKGGVTEILRGRTGLNDMFFIEPDGVRYGLFFEFGDGSAGLVEVSLQSRGFSADEFESALSETWEKVRANLEAEFGKPALSGAYPAKDSLKDGLSLSSDIWKTPKGEVYLGIGESGGSYSCVVRIREKGFLAPQ